MKPLRIKMTDTLVKCYQMDKKMQSIPVDEGFINESTMNELVSEKETYLDKEDLNKFLDSNNLTRESFIGLNILDKLDLMLKEFGAEEVMGKSSQALTFEEAFHIVETE